MYPGGHQGSVGKLAAKLSNPKTGSSSLRNWRFMLPLPIAPWPTKRPMRPDRPRSLQHLVKCLNPSAHNPLGQELLRRGTKQRSKDCERHWEGHEEGEESGSERALAPAEMDLEGVAPHERREREERPDGDAG